jgi:hypothetical protein
MASSIDIFEAYTSFQVQEDGSFIIPKSFVAEIKLYFKGKNIEVIARKKRSRRSLQQNRYLHMLFGIFSREMIDLTGDRDWTPAVIKSEMKLMFLKTEKVDEETGEVQGEYIKDTHNLNKTEMAEFFDNIIQYAAMKHGIKLKYPNEQLDLI